MYDLEMSGLAPQLRELLTAQAKFNAGDVVVVVKRANVTPAPTAAVWSYIVPFELQTAAGEVIPYTGNIVAAIADTSSLGTAAIDDSTPPMVMGYGEVVVSGDAAAWTDGETATVTLTYTTAYAVAKTDTFVVTFTA